MFKEKIFLLFFIFILLFSSLCFATENDTMFISSSETEANNNWINSDISSSDERYFLDNTIVGNAFITAKDFIMNPKNNGGIISGNLFAMALNAKLESDVKYSNEASEDGSYAIETINSGSVVYGNAYIMADTFILEPGSEIDGDLYIMANTIELSQDSIIRGNLFALGQSIKLNGSIGQSAYVSCSDFTMNSTGFIYRDLNLSSSVSNLNGKINRNVNIDSPELSLGSNLLVSGNLDYSSNDELELSHENIKGEINYSEYTESNNIKSTFFNTVFSFISFIVYVFAIALLFKFIFCKKSEEKCEAITVNTVLSSFGIGLISIFVVLITAIILFISSIAANIGIILVLTYVLLLFIATPTFILCIAKQINLKANIYLRILIVATALFIIKLIPFVGGFVDFIFTLTGCGRLIKKLIKK